MGDTTVYLVTIFVAALAGFAATAWMHTYGAHKARQARKNQRALDKQVFVNTYRNAAQALICTQPLVCYYNERVNKKEVRAPPLFESLPKLCWIARDSQLLKMDTRLAVQWAVEFSACRAAFVGDCLRALDRLLWPPDPEPETAKRRHSCGPAVVCIAQCLYGLVQPRAVYQYSQKVH